MKPPVTTRAPDAAGPPLSPGRHLALVGRSLLLQASWSFERMQSVGFAAALAGEGRRLCRGDASASRAFLERQLAYFNTNPAMASYLLGATVRMEEAAASGIPGALEDQARFRRAAVSVLASFGDRLFWATLRPVATILAVVVAWVALGVGGVRGLAPLGISASLAAAWGAAIYLIVYNAAHLHHRVRGVQDGYRWGTGVAARVGRSSIRRLPDTIRPIGLVAIGLIVPLVARETHRGFGVATTALCAGLALLLAWHLRRRAVLGWGWGLVAVAVGLFYRLASSGR